jgi:hypothetical protein
VYPELPELVRSKVGPASAGTYNPPKNSAPAIKHTLIFRAGLCGTTATVLSTGSTNGPRRDTARLSNNTKFNKTSIPSLAFIIIHPYIKDLSENRQAYPAEALSFLPAHQGIVSATKYYRVFGLLHKLDRS